MRSGSNLSAGGSMTVVIHRRDATCKLHVASRSVASVVSSAAAHA
jgi:hypothetical protein